MQMLEGLARPQGYIWHMPLYEYNCQACGRRFSWLVGVVSDPTPPTCDRCGATQATKREVSRFARIRSEEQAIDDLADPDNFGNMDDPAAMRRWAKEMGSELGEDLGDEFDEYAESASGDGGADEAGFDPQ
jgi:putative FmdB family regulatory protein